MFSGCHPTRGSRRQGRTDWGTPTPPLHSVYVKVTSQCLSKGPGLRGMPGQGGDSGHPSAPPGPAETQGCSPVGVSASVPPPKKGLERGSEGLCRRRDRRPCHWECRLWAARLSNTQTSLGWFSCGGHVIREYGSPLKTCSSSFCKNAPCRIRHPLAFPFSAMFSKLLASHCAFLKGCI